MCVSFFQQNGIRALCSEYRVKRERERERVKKKFALECFEKKKRGDMAKVVNGMMVPQLTKKTNYDNWCLQMKTLLGSQDIWDIVESGYEEHAEDANQTVAQIAVLKKTRVKDKSALYFLYNVVDESSFEKIANVASSKEAWDILEVAYRGNERIRQVRLQALRV